MDIKPYLHYYLGCNVEVKHPEFVKYPPVKFIGINPKGFGGSIMVENSIFNYKPEEVKPILRRLSSITDEEKLKLSSLVKSEFVVDLHGEGIPEDEKGLIMLSAQPFHYLVSLGIWLFGDQAFEDGSIIDAATLTPPNTPIMQQLKDYSFADLRLMQRFIEEQKPKQAVPVSERYKLLLAAIEKEMNERIDNLVASVEQKSPHG